MTPSAFDFQISVAPSSGVRLLRWAVLALGAAGLALAAWLARANEDGWYLLVLGALMLWAGWRHGRFGLAWGRLDVDSEGRAGWCAFPALARADGCVPVRVERWFAGERLAWLRLRDPEGRRYEILVARGSVEAENWRRLAAWLVWLRRGAAS